MNLEKYILMIGFLSITKVAPIQILGTLDVFTLFPNVFKLCSKSPQGLAVAFVLGIYFGELVKALVNDLIMPIKTLAMPEVQWDLYSIGPFTIGHFIMALITLIIVALVIFLLVKIAKKWSIE